MWVREQRFPIVTGPLVSVGRAGLIVRGWSPVTVRARKPVGTTADPLTRRMVTIRDDGGSSSGRTQARRLGVNVWADDPVDAENMALDLVSIFQAAPNGVVVAATSEFVGPYEVPEDVPLVVGGKNLTHFYFSFRAVVKAAGV